MGLEILPSLGAMAFIVASLFFKHTLMMIPGFFRTRIHCWHLLMHFVMDSLAACAASRLALETYT